MKLLGVDTGGTFTDLVLFDGGKFHVHKQASTPDAPEQAIIEGIRALGLEPAQAMEAVHGSTVGTNAVLENKGVKTAYVANRGFGDVLTIGRQARSELYRLAPPPATPPVPPELCLETGGRIGVARDGASETIEDLTDDDLATLKARLEELAPEAVAINLLFSFADDRFERMIEDALKDDFFVSRSSRVLPEPHEYERGITTWLNGYVGPIMQRYLKRLGTALPGAKIEVMQSHGKTVAARQAADYAVQLLLSGPAGGVIAARRFAESSGARKALSFDMGGTSTDVSVVDGDVTLTTEGRIGAYPVATQMVEVHAIGAGGGSIAYCDEGGLLRVGPHSAGAQPGPACYRRGGEAPTVTDANLLLERLPARLGPLTLDREAAEQAFAPLADTLGKSVANAARGVIDVVNEQMAQALRVMSVQRGRDPAEFTLIGFGAAGGLHVCALAERMKMNRAMVPAHAGVLSALGMLIAPRGLQKSRALCVNAAGVGRKDLDGAFEKLQKEAADEMYAQGVETFDFVETAELRYTGQSACLVLERRPPEELEREFHAAHEHRFGYRLPAAVELVTLRVHARAASPIESIGADLDSIGAADEAEKNFAGPAVVADTTHTAYVERGWRARRDGFGNLHLRKE